MANKHMKKCSVSLIFRKMQIKTYMRCHLAVIRVAIIKKSTNNNNTGEGPAIPVLEIYSTENVSGKDENSNSKRNMPPNVHSSTIYSRQDSETT